MVGLYARVLGPSWQELHETVRRLHIASQGVRATGTFRVRRGGWIARRLAWLAGLPQQSDAVPLLLVVTANGEREEWSRSFAGRPFVSRQWKHADGILAEHVGLFVQRFRLHVADGSLHYLNHSSAVRLGFISLPLPNWMAPRVTASEIREGDQIIVSVETRLPLVGLLVSYGGTVSIEEPASS
jgi:hypothetical protein